MKEKKIKKVKKKKKIKKGFTLIELLAVIIILGVIMLIAIPSVTRYINDSRKNSYIDTAKQIVKGAIPVVNSGELDVYDTDTTYYIPASCIPTENSMSSPFGEFVDAYVIVGYTEDGFNYYWASVDKAHQGIEIKEYNKLDKSDVKSNVEKIEPNIGIGNRSQIKILDAEECNSFGDSIEADNMLNENGEVNEAIHNPIYWALRDNNSDGTNETLLLSNSAIDGELSGVFSGNTHFTSRNDVPWSVDNFQTNVTNVDIISVIYPKSTSHWFERVGYKSNSFTANLSNLKVDNVIYMEYMFNNTCYNARTCTIGDISDWNTSNVINMEALFWGMGYNSNSFYIDVSNWNTSNVENMNYVFTVTGYESSSWYIGDLSNWNVSKVTKMHSLFAYSGYRSPTWHVGDLSRWDTGNVEDMAALFSTTSHNSTTWNVGNIGNWNTSKVTSMASMFYETCSRCSSFNVDMSHWDTSNVTSMTNVFKYAGRSASSWIVKIPRNNGGGITNTTTTLYGKTTDISTESTLAKNNATFTLVG